MVKQYIREWADSLPRTRRTLFFESDPQGRMYQQLPSELRSVVRRMKPDAWMVADGEIRVLLFDIRGWERDRVEALHRRIWSADKVRVAGLLEEGGMRFFDGLRFDAAIRSMPELPRLTAHPERLTRLPRGGGDAKQRARRLLADGVMRAFDELRGPFTAASEQGIGVRNWLVNVLFVGWLIDMGFSPDAALLPGDGTRQRRRAFGELLGSGGDGLRLLFAAVDRKFDGMLLPMGEMPDPEVLRAGGWLERLARIDLSALPAEVFAGVCRLLTAPPGSRRAGAPFEPERAAATLVRESVGAYLQGNPSAECTVFDPALVSGVFLAQALRQVADSERRGATFPSERAFLARMGRLLTDNFTGMAARAEGVRMGALTLYLTLLEEWRTPEVWPEGLPRLAEVVLLQEADPAERLRRARAARRWWPPRFITGAVGHTERELLLGMHGVMGRHTLASLLVPGSLFFGSGGGALRFYRLFRRYYALLRCRPLFFAGGDGLGSRGARPVGVCFCRRRGVCERARRPLSDFIGWPPEIQMLKSYTN